MFSEEQLFQARRKNQTIGLKLLHSNTYYVFEYKIVP